MDCAPRLCWNPRRRGAEPPAPSRPRLRDCCGYYPPRCPPRPPSPPHSPPLAPAPPVPSPHRVHGLGFEIVAVITRPDAPLGRRRILTPSSVAEAAEKLGL